MWTLKWKVNLFTIEWLTLLNEFTLDKACFLQMILKVVIQIIDMGTRVFDAIRKVEYIEGIYHSDSTSHFYILIHAT
jgi:hypothetical protein